MKSSQMLKRIGWVVFLIFAVSCAANKAVVQPPQPAPAVQETKISAISRISHTEEEKYTRIQIVGSEPMAPPFYRLLPDPLRIVLDVPNVDLRQIKGPIKIDNGTISEILVTQYDDKGRIEIGLVQMANYNISKEEKNLFIDVEKVKKVAEVKEAVKDESAARGTETAVSEPKKEETLPAQPVVSPPPPEPLNRAKEVINVTLEQKEDYVTYDIIADGKIGNYDSFKLDAPPRLVLDIWNIATRYPQRSIKTKNPYVKEVRLGRYPDKLRIVFEFLQPPFPPYRIDQVGEKLVVSLGNVPPSSGPQIVVQGKGPEGVSPKVGEGAPKSTKPSTLKEIDFKQMDNKSRITIALTAESTYQAYTMGSDAIAVDIKNASVPKHLLRGLDTSEFESAVNYISLQNVRVGKANDIRILIKLRQAVPFETSQEGSTLYVDVERPAGLEAKVEPAPVKAQAPAAEVKEGAKKGEEKPVLETTPAEQGLPPAEEKRVVSEEGVSEKVYTGRKLSLDFKDADIKNILRLIAEVSNLNIIAGDDVTGKVTMRLVDVPWDQALDVILQSRALGMSRAGNVVRVAPIEVLKREYQSEMEAKRAKDKLEDLVTELIPVNYATAKEILTQAKSILSDRGDVRVDDRTNTLIVKDIPRNLVAVRSLVKSLDTRTPQVLIEARIIEAALSFQQELGVQWGFLIQAGKAGNKSLEIGGGIPGTSLGTSTNKVIDLPAVPATGSGLPGLIEFLFTSAYGLKELDIAISAHEGKGDVRIISSPKIATLDNKQASIEQGLRIPYLKLTTEGTVTTEFIEANLKLTVTPHVTNDNNIKMLIDVRKDAPDYTVTVQGVPRIDKKEAISEVLVKDNGVVVIAGVYTIEKDSTKEGVPLFNKIPLLGWLFKRDSRQDSRKDLLIFISPKIIKDVMS